jgi:hypothetical protein
VDLGDDGITLNDAGDTDSGPNNLLNTPELLYVETFSGVTLIRGRVNTATSPATMKVELYRHQTVPTGEDEISLYLGRVSPDASGRWTYSTSSGLTIGDSITAVLSDAFENSSEYARPRAVIMGGGYSMSEETPNTVRSPSRPPSAIVTESKVVAGNGSLSFTVTVKEPCWGVMEIFTPTGELVHTLMNRWLPMGSYSVEWDRKNWRGDQVAQGNYNCRLDANGVTQNTALVIR